MNDSDSIFGIMASLGHVYYSVKVLIVLCDVLGISENSVRTNLHRMVKKGILDSKKDGKKAFYYFGSKGIKISRNVAQGFFTPDWKKWDNQWVGIIYSIPENQKTLRHKVRKKLELYRFASLYPGFWMRPCQEKLPVNLDDIVSREYCDTIIFKPERSFSVQKIQELWNIKEIHREMIEALSLINKEIKIITSATPEEAFKRKIIMGEKMVSTLFKDPLLPDQFLPKDWSAARLRKSFFEFDSLASKRSETLINKIIVEEGND
ncbi:MAG: BlaI/MecI/CopY family transcriptional regulator [Spirochaetales bacterium]|nr:BlaI/MecI/CopY family transcriptional regulator [Spirochaetales bacterium]